MRKDFSKILVERERVKSHRHPTNLPKFAFSRNQGWDEDLDGDDYDHSPISMRKAHVIHDQQKHLNENLAPLRNFLIKSLGKPWNNVYSEIRKNIHPNNAIQYHIIEHLNHMVIQDPRRIQQIKDEGRFYKYNSFYVNEKGILSKFIYKKRKRNQVQNTNALIYANFFDHFDYKQWKAVAEHNSLNAASTIIPATQYLLQSRQYFPVPTYILYNQTWFYITWTINFAPLIPTTTLRFPYTPPHLIQIFLDNGCTTNPSFYDPNSHHQYYLYPTIRAIPKKTLRNLYSENILYVP